MKDFTEQFYLSAGEAGPEQVLPAAKLLGQLIEVASLHANELGFGYRHMMASGTTWVLSRIAIEMEQWPPIDSHYSITTWVESARRFASTRNFEIADAAGRPIGHSRSLWAGMNFRERTLADISALTGLTEVMDPERPCPIEPAARHKPVTAPTRTEHYRFTYSDIDSNRHVNSVRYLQLALNQWPLDHFDRHALRRVELSYIEECCYGMEADLLIAERPDGADLTVAVDGTPRTHIALWW